MLVIFADDLTGACDVAAATGADAWIPLRGRAQCPHRAVVYNLETRGVTPGRAREVVRAAVRDVRPAYWKLDSLLRGNWAHEIAAAMEAGAIQRVMVAPAFPEQQRVMRGGVQYARGEPVGDVAAMLREAGVAAFRVVDDLRAAVPEGDETPAGSAGLARTLWGPRAVAPAAVGGSVLVVVGTASPRGREQLESLRGMEGVEVVEPDAPGRLLEAVGQRAARQRPEALVVAGGETLAGVARLFGFAGLLVRGEVGPGAALADIHGGALDGSQVITKAGDFGGPGALAEAVRMFRAK